jgi:uncharacterized protein
MSSNRNASRTPSWSKSALGIILLMSTNVSILIKSCIAQDDASTQPQNSHEKEILDWQLANEKRFQEPFGWLALTGHYWLQEGINSVGSDANSQVKLPENLPPNASGSIFVKGRTVELRTGQDSPIQINGRSETNVKLSIDSSEAESDGSDKITIGDRVRLQLVRRVGRFAIRVRDRESSLLKEFKGKKWHPPRPEYRVEATFTPYEPVRSIQIVNIQGDSVESKVVGSLKFRIQDNELQLDAFSESPDSLFLVFKDRTSGKTTYAPGRFLTTEAPVNGRVILDFNKAYNPPCAFSPHTLCPLPPKQNHLDIEIAAGELKPAHD